MNQGFIEFINTCFRYPEQDPSSEDIIRSINVSIKGGEYVAVVGANGSGKTTLVKLIDGLLFPTSGELIVAGTRLSSNVDMSGVRREIGIVFQSPEDQIVATTVEEDIAFGLENFGVPTAEMKTRVRKVLEGFDLWDVKNRPTYMLSGGQTQRLALASAIALQPSCLIFDESTSMLDPSARKNLLGLMKSFHQEGKTILHITHSMEEAAQADRILVMNKGLLVFDGSADELFFRKGIDIEWNLEYPESIELLHTLGSMGVILPEQMLPLPELAKIISEKCEILQKTDETLMAGNSDSKKVVEVSGLKYEYLKDTPHAVTALSGISFEVTESSGHGLIGKTGSGKSTILQHLNGILRPQAGSVRVGEFVLNEDQWNMVEVVQFAGLVLQNPENQFFEYYVGDEIAFGPKKVKISEKISERVRWSMEVAGLDFYKFKDRPIHTLSGGEKRKVALASILALKPSLLILDEPTAGLDPLSRKDVLASFRKLMDEGITIVVASHNLKDISELTDELSIIENGVTGVNGSTRSILSDVNILLNHGIDPPFITKLVDEVNRIGSTKITGVCSIRDLTEILITRENALQ